MDLRPGRDGFFKRPPMQLLCAQTHFTAVPSMAAAIPAPGRVLGGHTRILPQRREALPRLQQYMRAAVPSTAVLSRPRAACCDRKGATAQHALSAFRSAGISRAIRRCGVNSSRKSPSDLAEFARGLSQKVQAAGCHCLASVYEKQAAFPGRWHGIEFSCGY